MLYKDDWEKTQLKYIEYWNRENHDRPLISIKVPKSGYTPKVVKAPEKLIDRWLDTEYIIKSSREYFASTYFGGDSFPVLNPNLGPDIFGAMLGCDIEFGENTSWSKHIIQDWSKAEKFEFNPDNKWWKKIKEMTLAAVNDAKGDYFVGITDIHAGADGLVSLRGPQELCFDIYDYPEEVKKVNFELLNAYKKVIDELYNITSKNLKGSSNWMEIWHPGKWYVTSCDFICMISQDMFSEFIVPELLEELEYLDASIFHLDGPGALKHLDALLEIDKLKGIQWVYGAGQPTAAHWIGILKKIQSAGKLISITIEPEDLDVLLDNLEPEGVFYQLYSNDPRKYYTEDDAKSILIKIENSYKKKLF